VFKPPAPELFARDRIYYYIRQNTLEQDIWIETFILHTSTIRTCETRCTTLALQTLNQVVPLQN